MIESTVAIAGLVVVEVVEVVIVLAVGVGEVIEGIGMC